MSRTEPGERVGAGGPPPPRLGRLLLRFGLFAGLVAAAFAATRWTPLAEWFEPERLEALLEDLRGYRWAPAGLILLWLILAPLGMPVSPLVLAGGAVFGVRDGWIYSFVGSMLGATAGFLLARALGHELIVHVLGRERFERVEKMMAKHGFLTLTRLRFIPIPYSLINFGAAFAGFRLPAFLASSALGLAPSLLIYTYFADALVRAAEGDRGWVFVNLGFALALVLLLTFLPYLLRLRRKARPDTD